VTGNIVPKNVGFYYIEPQVEQTITYLTLIKIPGDIIKIRGRFCQDNVRIYPKKESERKYFRHLEKQSNSLCDILEKEKDRLKKNKKLYEDDSLKENKKVYKNDPIYEWIIKFLYYNYCVRLQSHTSERTYFLDSDGFMIK
jgi:hypothetical protein